MLFFCIVEARRSPKKTSPFDTFLTLFTKKCMQDHEENLFSYFFSGRSSFYFLPPFFFSTVRVRGALLLWECR